MGNHLRERDEHLCCGGDEGRLLLQEQLHHVRLVRLGRQVDLQPKYVKMWISAHANDLISVNCLLSEFKVRRKLLDLLERVYCAMIFHERECIDFFLRVYDDFFWEWDDFFWGRECTMICFAPSVCPLAPRATRLCTKYKIQRKKYKIQNKGYEIQFKIGLLKN